MKATEKPVRRLYVDMDGVLADFEGHYEKVFGHRHDSVSDKVMHKTIRERPRVSHVRHDPAGGWNQPDVNSWLFSAVGLVEDVVYEEIDHETIDPFSFRVAGVEKRKSPAYGSVHFYADIPIIKGAATFVKLLIDLCPDLKLLSSCPRADYERAARAKRAWYQHHRKTLGLTVENELLPVIGGKNKALFMHAPGDVLIDDFEDNCEAWRAAGGQAIQHKGNHDETYGRVAALWKCV